MIFLEVIKENISLLIDSDTGYYHTFKIGDIIEQNIYDVKLSGKTILLRGDKEIDDKIIQLQYEITNFKTYGGVQVSSRMNVWKLIELGYVLDITKQVMRNKKLEELGI
jgi:hypothetical protein